MAVEKEIIVAIEFGSSKIRGVAGCKNIDGSVQVLDIEQVDARNCIRKGVVYNIDKTVMCLKHIVDKMENALEMRVRKVFVGIGGQSLRTKKNTVSRQFATKTVVSQELVDCSRPTGIRYMPAMKYWKWFRRNTMSVWILRWIRSGS